MRELHTAWIRIATPDLQNNGPTYKQKEFVDPKNGKQNIQDVGIRIATPDLHNNGPTYKQKELVNSKSAKQHIQHEGFPRGHPPQY